MPRITLTPAPHYPFATEIQIYISHVIVTQYQSEAFHGETMRVEMTATDFNKYGFDLQFRLTEKETRRAVSLGKLGIVFIDPQVRKVTPVPPAFMAKVGLLV